MRWLLVASVLMLGCKSNPIAIVGDGEKLRRDDALPRTSPIFDGEVVRLRGARGETLGVQVLSHGKSRVALSLVGLRVDAFRVRYLHVTEPSTAMYGPSRGAGWYPDPLEPARAPVDGDALFDVVIPDDATPGRHGGTLTVDGRLIPVELRVEPATVKLEPFVWIWYRLDEMPAGQERAYHALARAHGAYFASDLRGADFEARRELMAGTRYWPVSLDDKDARAAADAWERTFAALPQVAFVTTVDEPATAEARAEARRMGEAIGKHPHLLRAVTAAPSPDFGDAIDVFISPASRPPHRWTYNGAPPSAGSLILDGDGTALRTWGWIAMRYDVELWYAWEGTYYQDRYNEGGPTDVLHNPLTFDQRRKHAAHADWGNGDGVLVYPGPWPSLRLKALRRGLQDRALLQALAACGAGDVVAKETRALVPRALDEGQGEAAWPRDEAAWEAARGRLYDAWRARCADLKQHKSGANEHK